MVVYGCIIVRSRHREMILDLTAVPAGLQAGRMFIWLFSIMLPVYLSTNDAELAFKVGVLAL